MHHVIQKNMWNEFGYAAMLRTLEEANVPHSVVNVVPFAHTLEPDIDLEGDVMVWGATTLGHIAAAKGWKPGRIQNENFDMRVLHDKYGQFMLNDDAEFCAFGDVKFEGSRFIRPVHDSKSFSGTVVTAEEFDEWKTRVLDVTDGFTTLKMDTPVMIAKPKEIGIEARFFVVDGKVVTGSSYRTFNRQILYQRIDMNNPLFSDTLRFAQEMVYRFQPDRAFVMDIGGLGDELRVVEINCINNSGFYACDMGAVVRALELVRWTPRPLVAAAPLNNDF
jgi:hypothetical protein